MSYVIALIVLVVVWVLRARTRNEAIAKARNAEDAAWHLELDGELHEAALMWFAAANHWQGLSCSQSYWYCIRNGERLLRSAAQR